MRGGEERGRGGHGYISAVLVMESLRSEVTRTLQTETKRQKDQGEGGGEAEQYKREK